MCIDAGVVHGDCETGNSTLFWGHSAMVARRTPNSGSSVRPSPIPDDVEVASLLQVDGLLDTLENRWAGYWLEMQSLIREHAPGYELPGYHLPPSHGRAKRIRSAIYGDIDLQYPELTLLLDMPYVQRLRQISQMGLVHLVYPEARHSRFDHTLGVAWNARQYCTSLEGSIRKTDKKTLLAAAILHDIGHGPFSHCTEMWEESLCENRGGVWGWSGKTLGMPAYHSFPVDHITIDKSVKPHEANGVRLIYDHPIALALVRRGLARIGTEEQRKDFRKTQSLGIWTLLRLLGVNPITVAQMIVGDRVHGGPLVGIINGNLDADKFDYYQRDAYFTGAGQAGADVNYIIHNVTLAKHLPQGPHAHVALAWPAKAVNDIVFGLMSRKYFYANTANHPVAQNANAMLATAFFESYRALQDACKNLQGNGRCKYTAGKLLAYLPFMEDQDIWSFLDIMARAKCSDRCRQDRCRVTGYIIGKLRARSLFDRSPPQTGTTGNEFTKRIYGALRKNYSSRKDDKTQLIDFVYLIDHTGPGARCSSAETHDLRGITLIDWGWSPDNQMDLKEFVTRKETVFGQAAGDSGPSICIVPQQDSRECVVNLSTALDDPDQEIAKGIARYEYSMSFVQILNDSMNSDAPRHGGRISSEEITALEGQIAKAWIDLQPTKTPRPDKHRIGPDPASKGLVESAVKHIL